MNKTEYMNTINEKLTVAEALCADLRKLRGLQKLAQSITAVIHIAGAGISFQSGRQRSARYCPPRQK